MMPVGFGKIVAMIGIKGFVIIGLALAMAVMWWRADTISGQRDAAIQREANERAAHAVTTASVNQLQTRLETYVADGIRRQKAATEALERQKARSAALDAQIARLRSQAPTAVEIERCETSEGVLEAEGL